MMPTDFHSIDTTLPRIYAKIDNTDNKVDAFVEHYGLSEPDAIEGYTLVNVTNYTIKPSIGSTYDANVNTFVEPEPEAVEISIDVLKAEYKASVSLDKYNRILDEYPLQEQLFLMNQYDSYKDTIEDKNIMLAYINNIRDLCDTYISQIDNCTTKEDLYSLTFTWQ